MNYDSNRYAERVEAVDALRRSTQEAHAEFLRKQSQERTRFESESAAALAAGEAQAAGKAAELEQVHAAALLNELETLALEFGAQPRACAVAIANTLKARDLLVRDELGDSITGWPLVLAFAHAAAGDRGVNAVGDPSLGAFPNALSCAGRVLAAIAADTPPAGIEAELRALETAVATAVGSSRYEYPARAKVLLATVTNRARAIALEEFDRKERIEQEAATKARHEEEYAAMRDQIAREAPTARERREHPLSKLLPPRWVAGLINSADG